MQIARWIGLILGILLVFGNWLSVIRTLIAPRSFYSRGLSVLTESWRKLFKFTARRLPNYNAKDRLLSLQEPVLLILLLAIWLAIFQIGFTLIIWRVTTVSFFKAFELAGSAEFTLGFSTPRGSVPLAVVFITAMTGLIVVALEVGFLPTLYSSYNRRERLITMLESRAGSPAWGPEILARHALVGLMEDLPNFYSSWESWAADVGESHTTHSFLLHFRSPKPLASWIIALLAVLDSAALLLAFSPSIATIDARLSLRMGFTALRDIADSIHVKYDSDPRPDAPILLSFDEFKTGVERMIKAGFPTHRSIEEAWVHFKGWRVNYESIAYEIADYVAAPVAPWSGERKSLNESIIEPIGVLNRRPGDPGDENPIPLRDL